MNKLYLIFIIFLSTPFIGYASQTETEKSSTSAREGIGFLTSLFSTEAFANIILGIAVLVGTFLVSKIVDRKLNDYFEGMNKDHDQTKEGVYGMITRSLNITIWFMGITLMFGTMGLDMALFVGGIGIGIGFTMQIFLSNFIYGIIMVTQGTLRNGDMIDLGGELSKVEKVNPLFTIVKRLDGVKSFIPNIKFLQDRFSNLHLNETRRLDLEVTIENSTDMTKMKILVSKVMENIPGVLKDPEHTIWFMGLDDKGVRLKILFWTKSKDKVFTIRSNVIETLNLAFIQAGITVSYMDFLTVNFNDKDVNKIVESKLK